ncbi:LysR family transcriptional regulator|uniref:DNA-binding transcriptional regulator, LysR family n=1 Tax=Dendrosporobacter quercicolus TaxID=146817 RepID=A0A1G9NAD9_9FIRM|nr:LysR family transcriptional regulator [Dendrosporobacter quercicolus]NSL47279.1 LysR family transcriptional regulator [Dendrosporobacter quercicolus DSM 1736]SDL83486.1 DNA-binding transcriptional regulator, LysR family [Dendrosporobacter quercicolus]
MNLNDIKIFQEVVYQGSMTQAAEKLGYAQSSVTARMRKLEEKLKVKLFYRSARGVHPTPAGKLLLEYGLRIARTMDELQFLLHSNGVPGGLLRIGSMETTAAIRLPSLLKEYHSLYDRVELSLQTGTTGHLISQILNYELDLAFVAAPVNHADIVEMAAFEEAMVLVAAGGQNAAGGLDILQNRTILVFRSGCSYRSLLEQYLAETKSIPLKRFEFGSLEAIIGSVAAGIGISLLPESVIEEKLQSGILSSYALPSHLGKCTTMLIWRKDAVPTLAMTKFIDLIHSKP